MRTMTPAKSKSFAFRLSVADAELLEQRFEFAGVPSSEYVRRLVALWLCLPDPVPERWTRPVRDDSDQPDAS